MPNWIEHFTLVNQGELVTFGAELMQTKYIKLSAADAAQALVAAYHIVTGKKPSIQVLGFMLAQTGLETGQWNLPGNNWGGVKFSASRDKYYQYLPCGEVDQKTGVEIKYPAGDPHCIFAAYPTAADGAVQYVRTLKGRAHWWEGLHSKDLSSFVKGLQGVPGQFYMTASANKYQAALQTMLNQFEDVAKKYGVKPWLKYVWGAIGALGAGAGYLGYRNIKANPRISGLGDVVKAGTSAIGIKPCTPCQRRAAWLNQHFPL